MTMLLDPVLASYVEDFAAGVSVLKTSVEDQHRLVAENLCKLSREIRFRVGPPRLAPPELIAEIVALFRAAVDAIKNPAADKKLEAYRSNINDRAEILERENEN